MTQRHPDRHVVAVGIDDTDEALEAARFAAQAAADRGWDLLVVHGYRLPPGTPGVTAELVRGAEEAGERLVDDVLAEVRVDPRTHVTRMVTSGALVMTLRAVSREASLLVLGRHHPGLAHQLLVGRVGPAVAARAACPVVVVPLGWGRWDEVRGPVVVALDVEGPGDEALRLAFEEAELRRVGVVALHAVPLREQAGLADEQVSLQAVLAGAEQDHPDVHLRTLLVPGDPRERLVEESLRASLLVVGRPHRPERWGAWTGSVARAVMDTSFCPLLIAAPAHHATPPRRPDGRERRSAPAAHGRHEDWRRRPVRA